MSANWSKRDGYVSFGKDFDKMTKTLLEAKFDEFTDVDVREAEFYLTKKAIIEKVTKRVCLARVLISFVEIPITAVLLPTFLKEKVHVAKIMLMYLLKRIDHEELNRAYILSAKRMIKTGGGILGS